MRLRVDQWWTAGAHRAYLLGSRDYDHGPWDTAPALPGDVWICRIAPDGRSHYFGPNGPEYRDWSIEGYALTCPIESCRSGVHSWTHAYNCPRGSGDGQCKAGGPSCWTWTGTIPHLSGHPSLQVLGACEFHGYLTDGVMRSV